MSVWCSMSIFSVSGWPAGSFFFFSSRRRHTRWPRAWSSDVCSSDLRRVHARVASHAANGQTGTVEFRLDSATAPPFATTPVSDTGGWDRYVTVDAAAATTPVGVHKLYVTFASAQPWEFVNVKWLAFDPPPRRLVGRWAFDDADGPAALDSSGHDRTAVLQPRATRAAGRLGYGSAL